MSEVMVLFGGTFDPVHFGHLITARSVAEQRGFRGVTLIPTALPPHKEGPHASPADRLAMLELAGEDDPLLSISRVELERAGPSYTLDTLRTLGEECGQGTRLCWVIGADMLPGLASWHCVGEVLEEAKIIVAARPPWQDRMEEMLAKLSRHLDKSQVAIIKEAVVDTPLIDISSSDIRRRIAEGRPIRYLLPESVRAYIDKHGLYR